MLMMGTCWGCNRAMGMQYAKDVCLVDGWLAGWLAARHTFISSVVLNVTHLPQPLAAIGAIGWFY